MLIEGGVGIEPRQLDSRVYTTIWYNLLIYSFIWSIYVFTQTFDNSFPGKCCCLRISIALVILNKFFSPNRVKNKEKIINVYFFLFHSSSGCTMKGQHALNVRHILRFFHYKPQDIESFVWELRIPPLTYEHFFVTCLTISYLISVSHTTEHQ